ncbi:hypothetical protein [Prosthecomicrobium sp. N25]|uniref:hypothetical protein n=1 Tax=Prosthecomicrobium sp. N25 TaxID=3129254 RepID=UPI0030776A68
MTDDTGAGGTAVDFGMTDLEEVLRGPEGAFVRAGLIERFRVLQEETRAAMDAGLTPDDFAKAEALLRGLAAASKLVLAFPVISDPVR